MFGPGELVIVGALVLLFGGGGGMASLLTGMRRQALARAREVVEEEVRKAVPEELREAARDVRRVVHGDEGAP